MYASAKRFQSSPWWPYFTRTLEYEQEKFCKKNLHDVVNPSQWHHATKCDNVHDITTLQVRGKKMKWCHFYRATFIKCVHRRSINWPLGTAGSRRVNNKFLKSQTVSSEVGGDQIRAKGRVYFKQTFITTIIHQSYWSPNTLHDEQTWEQSEPSWKDSGIIRQDPQSCDQFSDIVVESVWPQIGR